MTARLSATGTRRPYANRHSALDDVREARTAWRKPWKGAPWERPIADSRPSLGTMGDLVPLQARCLVRRGIAEDLQRFQDLVVQ
jgi:hypothetical protein